MALMGVFLMKLVETDLFILLHYWLGKGLHRSWFTFKHYSRSSYNQGERDWVRRLAIYWKR